VGVEDAADGAPGAGVWRSRVEHVSTGGATEEGAQVTLSGNRVRRALTAQRDEAINCETGQPYLQADTVAAVNNEPR
jgi:hypothetical protein